MYAIRSYYAPDDFFETADALGLMIWSDFWVTGDTQGEFKGSPDWPLEGSVFVSNVTSTILRIRNHPSLLRITSYNVCYTKLLRFNFKACFFNNTFYIVKYW